MLLLLFGKGYGNCWKVVWRCSNGFFDCLVECLAMLGRLFGSV